ncbi:30S ribosomal protein S9 [Lacunimicrobium album]
MIDQENPDNNDPVAESSAPQLTLGGGAPAEEAVSNEPAHSPFIRGRIDQHGVATGTGRRKTAVARVRMKTGSGTITINGRTFEEYFVLERDQNIIKAPLDKTSNLGKLDVSVRVEGGGTTGQAGAVMLGIARALQALNNSNHTTLAEHGYLTRDSRMVERKKYGFKKARKSFQFSKR